MILQQKFMSEKSSHFYFFLSYLLKQNSFPSVLLNIVMREQIPFQFSACWTHPVELCSSGSYHTQSLHQNSPRTNSKYKKTTLRRNKISIKEVKAKSCCHLVHWNNPWICHVHHLALYSTRCSLAKSIRNKKEKTINIDFHHT